MTAEVAVYIYKFGRELLIQGNKKYIFIFSLLGKGDKGI
jgi:hypothetical protein